MPGDQTNNNKDIIDISSGRGASSRFSNATRMDSIFRPQQTAIGTDMPWGYQHAGMTTDQYAAENQRLIDTWSAQFDNDPQKAWNTIVSAFGMSETQLCSIGNQKAFWVFDGGGDKTIFDILDKMSSFQRNTVYNAAYALGGGVVSKLDVNGYQNIGDFTYDEKKLDTNTQNFPVGAEHVVKAIIKHDRAKGDTEREIQALRQDMGKAKNVEAATLYQENGEDADFTLGDVGSKYSPENVAYFLYSQGKLQALLDSTGVRYTGREDWADIDWSKPVQGVPEETRQYLEKLSAQYDSANTAYLNALQSVVSQSTGENAAFAKEALWFYRDKNPTWEPPESMRLINEFIGDYDPKKERKNRETTRKQQESSANAWGNNTSVTIIPQATSGEMIQAASQYPNK